MKRSSLRLVMLICAMTLALLTAALCVYARPYDEFEGITFTSDPIYRTSESYTSFPYTLEATVCFTEGGRNQPKALL